MPSSTDYLATLEQQIRQASHSVDLERIKLFTLKKSLYNNAAITIAIYRDLNSRYELFKDILPREQQIQENSIRIQQIRDRYLRDTKSSVERQERRLKYQVLEVELLKGKKRQEEHRIELVRTKAALRKLKEGTEENTLAQEKKEAEVLMQIEEVEQDELGLKWMTAGLHALEIGID